MDKLLEAYCDICVKMIYDKTSVAVPKDIITFETMREENDSLGIKKGYYKGNQIKINTRVAQPYIMDRKFSRMVNFCALEFNIGNIIEDKELHSKLNEYNNNAFTSTISTIIHEYGHWFHRNFLDFKPQDIPIENSKRKDYCQKDEKENFAVAFEEYILDKIPKNSCRYERMEQICKNIELYK